jgi:integrase/recombinase XerD
MKYLHNSNQLLTNPAEDMEFPRLPHRLPVGILSAEEIERIFALPDLDPEQAFSYRWQKVAFQTRAIVELLLATDIRRAELAGLKLSDLNRAAMTLLIREGKGAKDCVVPMTPRALYWLDQYLAFLDTKKTGEDYIFQGRRKGTSLSIEGLHNAISRIFKKAEIDRHGTCHLFRHTLATMLLDAGAELRHIQELLGHESISSTDTYTHVSIGKLKEVHTATHPTA